VNRGVHVERDPEGLQVALRELFEEAFCREAIRPVMEQADEETRNRAMDDMPMRTLSPGYYSRAEYILDLGSAIEAGAAYSAEVLGREDVTGLQALKRAKQEFEHDHPACSCGTRQHNRYIFECRSCHAKLVRRHD
jgi:hypothetical protein